MQTDFIRKTSIGISASSNREQMAFLDTVFTNLDDLQKIKWLEKVSTLVYPKTRWIEIEQWMEKRFIKKISRTPVQVGYMCMNYLRINRKMKPLIIKLAQKVKARVIIREKRKNIKKVEKLSGR